nr:hypothetical protein [Tanacetum cinerariifolium]
MAPTTRANMVLGNSSGGSGYDHGVVSDDMKQFTVELVDNKSARIHQILDNFAGQITNLGGLQQGGNIKWRFKTVFDDPMSELKNVKYETNAKAYQDAFDNLLSRVEITRCTSSNLEKSKRCSWSSEGQELEAVRVLWCADYHIHYNTVDFVGRKEISTYKVHSDQMLNNVRLEVEEESEICKSQKTHKWYQSQVDMDADMDADVDVTLKDVVVVTKDSQDAEMEESTDVQGRKAESQAQIYQIDLEHADKKEDNIVKSYQALKRKPQTEAQAMKNMMIYLKNVDGFKMDYFKGMTYDDIRPIFKKKFKSNVAFLLKTKEQMDEEDSRALKRLSETQEEKAAKKQKLDEEVAELKRHLQIVPNDEDDVYTEATPLARKVPVVDYKIYTEKNKPYYKIKRADERFASTKPKNFFDDFLLMTLGAMFEKPDIITFTTTQLILLVERRYPLTRFTLDQMLNNVRLEVEEESEVSLELLSFGVDDAEDFKENMLRVKRPTECKDKRAKNLCFYCDQKYAPDHKCLGQLYSLVVLTEEEDEGGNMDKFECLEEEQIEEFIRSLEISLNALNGIISYKTLRIEGDIKFNFKDCGMEFMYKGKKMTLRGSDNGATDELSRVQIAEMFSLIASFTVATDLLDMIPRSWEEHAALKELKKCSSNVLQVGELPYYDGQGLIQAEPVAILDRKLKKVGNAADVFVLVHCLESYCCLIHLLVLSNLEHPARLLLIQLIDDKLPVLDVNDRKLKHVEIAKGFMEIYFAANLGDGANGARLFDMLVHVYCTQFKSFGLDHACDVVRVISEKGVFLSLNTCNFLMSGLVKVGRFRKSYELFDVLRKGVEPDVYLFTNAINGLCKDGKVKEGMTVLLEMEKSGVLPNVVTYNNVIHGFCKAGDLVEAFRVKDKMVEKGVSPSVVTYSVLINGLLKMEKYNEAGRLLSEMTDNGFVPNEVVYNTLINGYCKIGDMKKALDVRDDMLTKGLNSNSVTYNTLIKGFCYTNQMAEAEKLLEEMLSANLTINAGSFTTVIHWLCKCSKMDPALRFVNEMLLRNFRPNDSLMTILVSGLCKQGKHLEAVDFWFRLLENRFFPNIVTSNALIHGLCESGNIVEAIKILKEMIKRGFCLDRITYNTLISWHCKEARFEEGLQLSEEMVKQGILPDTLTYTSLINGLCQKGKMDDAIMLLDKCKVQGLTPDVYTYGVIIEGFCKNDEIQKGKELFNELVNKNMEVNSFIYNTLIRAYSKNGDITEAVKLFNEMKSKGIQLSSVTYSSLIHGYSNNGYFDDAKRLINEMRDDGLSPNVVCYTALISGYCKMGQMDKVVTTLEEMSSYDIHPNKITYTVMIDGYCKLGQTELAVKLLGEMEQKGVVPDVVTYNALADGFSKEGKIGEAFRLFNDMSRRGLLNGNNTADLFFADDIYEHIPVNCMLQVNLKRAAVQGIYRELRDSVKAILEKTDTYTESKCWLVNGKISPFIRLQVHGLSCFCYVKASQTSRPTDLLKELRVSFILLDVQRTLRGHHQITMDMHISIPVHETTLRDFSSSALSSQNTAYPSSYGDDKDSCGSDLKPLRREVYGNGKIFDITHRISSETRSWDSDDGVGDEYLKLYISMKNGTDYNFSELKLPVHSGTHVDAPGHVFENYYDAGFDIDSLDLE